MSLLTPDLGLFIWTILALIVSIFLIYWFIKIARKILLKD